MYLELVLTMLEKQETAFGYLTRLAVWVQEQVPTSEAQGQQASVQRNGARETLAELWRRNASI